MRQERKRTKKVEGGYVVLISVLVMGAVGVSISLSLILLGLGSLRTSFSFEQSKQARVLADACAEEALEQIRQASNYIGTSNLLFERGNCTYTVTSQGNENRTVTARGEVGTVVKKVEVILNTINPKILISSWQEVGD